MWLVKGEGQLITIEVLQLYSSEERHLLSSSEEPSSHQYIERAEHSHQFTVIYHPSRCLYSQHQLNVLCMYVCLRERLESADYNV